MFAMFKTDAERIAKRLKLEGYEARAFCVVPGEWAVAAFGWGHCWEKFYTLGQWEAARERFF